jgi:hypothetical protein
MPLSDLKSMYTKKDLKFISRSDQKYFYSKAKKQNLMKTYYLTKRHDPHESYFYGFLCLIYDGVNTINEIKKKMRVFFISVTHQLIIEDQDVEEYFQYARKKNLINVETDGKINLTQEGKLLVESSYEATLHASYWMRILFSEKTILLFTAIVLVILSSLKIFIGIHLTSQGMTNEGFENLTDLIKVGIIYIIGFKLNKDKSASIIIIFIMIFTGITLLWSGIYALLNPSPIIPTIQSYIICFISIALNLGSMFLKSLVGRTSGNLTFLSDSKDSGLNAKISLGVAIGLTFAIFKLYFVDAIIAIIIGLLVFKEGIEILKELTKKEENFDVTSIKVAADHIYNARLTSYILGSIRRERITKEKLLSNFQEGLTLGREYYIGFADFFYNDLGPKNAEKHLKKLIEDKNIETLGDELTLTAKGLKIYYKAKAREYESRAQQIYLGRTIRKGVIYFLIFCFLLVLIIVYSNEINSWLVSF